METFRKVAQIVCCRKYNIFNQRCWETLISTHRWLKLGQYLIPWTKVNSQSIKGLSVKLEIMNEIARRKHRQDIGMGREFLSRNPFVQELRVTLNKWNIKNYKASVQHREMRTEKAYRVEGKTCQLHIW